MTDRDREAIAAPRPAATVCCFRPGPGGLEVLLAQRGETARFMGGAWVFPGGTVDAVDRSEAANAVLDGELPEAERPWRLAAARELVEEVGIWLASPPFADELRVRGAQVYEEAARRGIVFDGSSLTYFANWVTPTRVPVRFDTRFYATLVPDEVEPHPDPAELAAAAWYPPGEAVAAAERGELLVPFPTRKTLEFLARFDDYGDLVRHVESLGEVTPVQPRMRIAEDGSLDVVLPGEPGFDEIDEESGPDPEALRQAAQAGGTGAAPEVTG